MLDFNIRYTNDNVPRLQKFKGNCYDVTAEEVYVNGSKIDFDVIDNVSYSAGDVVFAKFGFAIDMTDKQANRYIGYVYPRSSTFKNYGLILTNHCGIIDNEYNGDEDHWCGMFLAMRAGVIKQHDRVAQIEFRPEAQSVNFNEVNSLGNNSRGGYGSTGK